MRGLEEPRLRPHHTRVRALRHRQGLRQERVLRRPAVPPVRSLREHPRLPVGQGVRPRARALRRMRHGCGLRRRQRDVRRGRLRHPMRLRQRVRSLRSALRHEAGALRAVHPAGRLPVGLPLRRRQVRARRVREGRAEVRIGRDGHRGLQRPGRRLRRDALSAPIFVRAGRRQQGRWHRGRRQCRFVQAVGMQPQRRELRCATQETSNLLRRRSARGERSRLHRHRQGVFGRRLPRQDLRAFAEVLRGPSLHPVQRRRCDLYVASNVRDHHLLRRRLGHMQASRLCAGRQAVRRHDGDDLHE